MRLLRLPIAIPAISSVPGNFPGNTVFPGVSVTAGDVLSNDTDLDLTDTHEVVGVAKGTVSNTTGSVGTTSPVYMGSWCSMPTAAGPTRSTTTIR